MSFYFEENISGSLCSLTEVWKISSTFTISTGDTEKNAAECVRSLLDNCGKIGYICNIRPDIDFANYRNADVPGSLLLASRRDR
jgi:hypothetical protein